MSQVAEVLQACEARHYPISPPDPIEAIKLRMEQDGLSVADMVPYIGRTPMDRVDDRQQSAPSAYRFAKRVHTHWL